MRIPELARRAGVAARTVRYYADRGLLPAAKRSEAGYREFGEEALRRLRFIRRVQALGMTLDDLAALLRAVERQSCGQASRLVAKRLTDQLGTVERRIAELHSVAHELRSVLSDQRTGCSDELCLCNAREASGSDRSSAAFQLTGGDRP